MSDSIYAPPEADIAVPESEERDFYVVSPTKCYLLSVLTLNLYCVYWFYRNWRIIKARENSSIWPVPRGLFYIFFTHSLFGTVNAAIKAKKQAYDWNPSDIASLFVLLTVALNILDRLAYQSIGSPMTDFAASALVLITPLLMLRAQRAINFVCDDPDGQSNSRFTLGNWVWIVLGGLVWILTFLGFYAMVFAPELLLE